jgi:hypothetical protein
MHCKRATAGQILQMILKLPDVIKNGKNNVKYLINILQQQPVKKCTAVQNITSTEWGHMVCIVCFESLVSAKLKQK